MLNGTIRNDDFLHNTALQHCSDIVLNTCNIVSTLQPCVAPNIVVVANRLASHHIKAMSTRIRTRLKTHIFFIRNRVDRVLNHCGERCKKDTVSVTGFIWFRVDERPIRVKKMRFQKYPDSCGRRLTRRASFYGKSIADLKKFLKVDPKKNAYIL